MDEQHRENRALRAFGFFFGVSTHVAFLLTVRILFLFLQDGGLHKVPKAWLFIDGLLAIQFAVIHSTMLHPRVKRWLTRFIKSEWYGLLFCCVTCATLTVAIFYWRVSSGTLWDLHGWAAGFVRGAFYASWVALFVSLWQSGLGYQTGLTPWWYWLRRKQQPRRQLIMHGLYSWLRHPIYLSFLGLIWFTPRMTWDHAVLTGIWTIYIFVGSYLKDERLAFYAGTAYREYQERVAGYPLLWWGPLGKRQTSSVAAVASTKSTISRAA